MFFHMKTTLNVADSTMQAIKREAARKGQTMSQLVEAALRSVLSPSPRKQNLTPLPEFNTSGTTVNVADRNALYEVMER